MNMATSDTTPTNVSTGERFAGALDQRFIFGELVEGNRHSDEPQAPADCL